MNQLWLGRRFQRSAQGSFEAWGKAGPEQVCLEVDGHFGAPEDRSPEMVLLKLHHQLKSAAREKWAAGEAKPVLHSLSGKLDHYRIVLTESDLRDLI